VISNENNLFITPLLLIGLTLIPCFEVYSWDDTVTHRDITSLAAETSMLGAGKVNYLRTLGLIGGLAEKLEWNGMKRTALEWIQEGARLEDEGDLLDFASARSRSYNHFHDPLNPGIKRGWMKFCKAL